MASPGCTHTLNANSLTENPFVTRRGLSSKGSPLVEPKKILLHLVIDTYSLARPCEGDRLGRGHAPTQRCTPIMRRRRHQSRLFHFLTFQNDFVKNQECAFWSASNDRTN